MDDTMNSHESVQSKVPQKEDSMKLCPPPYEVAIDNNDGWDSDGYQCEPDVEFVNTDADFPTYTHRDSPSGSFMKINISEVFSPYQFWFQKQVGSLLLDYLMTKINIFYNIPTNKTASKMLIQDLVPGRICVASYDSSWHRGKILTNFSGDPSKVKIFYVDYGTVGYVPVCDVKRLKVDFAKLPPQALRGCVANIKPTGCHWAFADSVQFLAKVSNRTLYARVMGFDDEKCIYYMLLYDTGEKKIFFEINSEMVDEGIAKIDFEWIHRRHTRIPHKREKYPSFELLESGVYPNLAQMHDLLKQGFDYEEMIDKKVYATNALNDNPDFKHLLRHLEFPLFVSNPFYKDVIEALTKEQGVADNQKSQ